MSRGSRWLLPLAGALALGARPSMARAEPGAEHAGEARPGATRPTWQADAEAYCRFVTGVADSESALALSPRVFGEAGVINGADAVGGLSALPPTARVTVGVSYSGADLYRGIVLRRRAKVECDRYRAVSQLHAFAAAYEDGISPRALEAKLRVLDAALPRAEEILGATKSRVEQSVATLDDLNAVVIKVNVLHDERNRARLGLDLAAGATPPPRAPLSELLRQHEDDEASVERYNAGLRESRGWDVGVKGGYDRVFGLRDHTPVFGLITASVSVGLLFQPGADARAVEGRRALVKVEVKGTQDRVAKVVHRLRATWKAEQARLDQVSGLVADLGAMLREVEATGGDKARRYAERVWFEVVGLRSEQEYLRAHVAELAAILGPAEAN